MIRLVRSTLINLSLIVLCGGVICFTADAHAFKSKKKRPQEVKVINGPDMPASVNVENEPNVAVTNTVETNTVVTNDEENPVPVVIRSEPFQLNESFKFSDELRISRFFTVPTGKRLVIEYMDAYLRGTTTPDQVIQARLNIDEIDEFSIANMVLTTPGGGFLGGGKKILFQVGSDVELEIFVRRALNGQAETYQVTLSGHFEDE